MKRILKWSLSGFLVVVGLVILAAVVLPKSYSLERSVVIDAPLKDVFDYLKLLKNQDNFSVWAAMDPAMTKTYRGVDGTVGFVSRWESQNPDVGVGEQEIKSIVSNERIDFELRFYEPFEGVSQAWMLTKAISEGQTEVVWGFQSSMPFPTNVLIPLMQMEKMIGRDFETGLSALKGILEKR